MLRNGEKPPIAQARLDAPVLEDQNLVHRYVAQIRSADFAARLGAHIDCEIKLNVAAVYEAEILKRMGK